MAVEEGHSQILGYVTLTLGNVLFENVTAEFQGRFPRFPIPVFHVRQLGTDISYQGLGIGSLLMRVAAERAIEASETVVCFAIELIVDNQMAFEWYLKRGFTLLVSGSLRLYQGIESLKLASGMLDV